MAERVESERAVVLHRKTLGEHRWLLELLTESFGRVGVYARGKRVAFTAQPFALLSVAWGGRGDLPSLRRMEADGASGQLAGDALICGLYLNELLLRLLVRWSPVPNLLPSYLATIKRLEKEEPQRPLREFEWWLLEQLGFALDLEGLDEGAYYRWQASQGLIRCEAHEGIKGQVILAAAAGQWDASLVPGAMKTLNKWRLAPLLGSRPLNARKLFTRKRLAIQR